MHKSNCIKATGYWFSFVEAAIQLRREALEANNHKNAEKYDICALMSVKYGVRVFGICIEFQKIAADDHIAAMVIVPGLERQMDISAVDNMVEPIKTLDLHMVTQLIRAIAVLKNSSEKNKDGGWNCGAADGQ